MAQIGNIPGIQSVKQKLDELKSRGLVRDWEIPYENILTRLQAAIFFLTPAEESVLPEIWRQLAIQDSLQYRLNEEKKLSDLQWRVSFDKE